MKHIDVQTLRAFNDPARVERRVLLHVDSCVACRRIAVGNGVSDAALRALLASKPPRTRGVYMAGAIAAIIAAAAALTPLRSAALGLVGIFEPHSVTAVPLTLDEMRSLGRMPDLSEYAQSREIRQSVTARFVDVRGAAAAAGFALRQPAYVPNGVQAVSYQVSGANTQLLTFVRRTSVAGHVAPVLPPDIVGSTLRIDLGAAVIGFYQTGSSAADTQRLRIAGRRLAASAAQRSPARSSASPIFFSIGASHRPPHVVYGRPSGVPPSTFGFREGANMLPLVIVQMPVPHIASTGVSLSRLASFMLDQPGIPPRVAAAFGALGDLSTTLPIPIPIDQAYTQPVSVDGVRGVGMGDNTGIGAAVVWQKNRMLYAVFATRTARDVLAIANSLR